jgi:HEPN domain-containing protein
MVPGRLPPDDPREWLNRARSSLTKAREGAAFPEIYLEDLCFDAQQAAEKAIKAVLLHLGVGFPYVHDLSLLLTRVEQAGQAVQEPVRAAAALTEYAVETRYPGVFEPVTQEEFEEAVRLAEVVLVWAQDVVDPPPPVQP